MNARDFFESVRDAALEETRAARQIERMRLREGVRGASLAPYGGGPKDVNGLSATNARMDYEAMMSRRLKEDRELIDGARAILYGAGEPGGVAVLFGSAVAGAVALRCISCENWGVVGDMCCVSPRIAMRWCDAAFDTVDSCGVLDVVQGIGCAEL